MAKVEITDAMVERFYAAYERNDWPVFSSVAPRIKAGLDAALNPPAEPEIVVTEEQKQAGKDAALQWLTERGFITRTVNHPQTPELLAAIYRAMRALEPEMPLPNRRKTQEYAPFPDGRRIHYRDGDTKPGAILHIHRRAGDK